MWGRILLHTPFTSHDPPLVRRTSDHRRSPGQTTTTETQNERVNPTHKTRATASNQQAQRAEVTRAAARPARTSTRHPVPFPSCPCPARRDHTRSCTSGAQARGTSCHLSLVSRGDECAMPSHAVSDVEADTRQMAKCACVGAEVERTERRSRLRQMRASRGAVQNGLRGRRERSGNARSRSGAHGRREVGASIWLI